MSDQEQLDSKMDGIIALQQKLIARSEETGAMIQQLASLVREVITLRAESEITVEGEPYFDTPELIPVEDEMIYKDEPEPIYPGKPRRP